MDRVASARSTGTPPRGTLFSSVRSPHCLKVSIALHEKGVPFDRVEIDLPSREQKTPPYLALQPHGTVPAYRDALGTQTDSWDVLLHLERVAPVPRLLPLDEHARARVERWVAHADTELRQVSHHLYWQRIEPPEGGPDAARVRELRANGDEELRAIETALRTSESGWLVPSEDVPGPSLADVAAYAWSANFRRYDLPSEGSADMPALMSWWERLDARPSVVASRNAKGRAFAAWLAEQEEGRGDDLRR